MNPAPSVIHFNCQTCGIPLTVPAQMAGVSGPCPQCGATITSPAATAPAQANPFMQQQPMTGAAPQMQMQSPVPAPQAQTPLAPQTSPVGAMAGANWPPAAAQPMSASGAHPVMERLLHSQTALPSAAPAAAPASLPAMIPPYQERSSTPPRRRVSSSRQKSKKGAMVLALLMAMLVLTGTSWFFRDQLRATWLSYTMKDDDAPTEGGPVSVSPGNMEPASFNPSAPAPPLPKAIPVAPQVATEPSISPPDTPQAVTVRPALPASDNPDTPSAPATSNLVEVPGTADPGPPVNMVPSPPPVPALVTGVTPESKPALEALQNFFHATTWKERLPYVQAPNSMTPLMEQYYAGNPDGPLHASHIQMIRHDKAPETGPPHCVFQVSGGGLKQPLPIMVEITEEGWKVDWLTFTEFKDDLLLKFLESPQPEPARFHVLMRRAHYFGDDVPGLDKKTCFQLAPPMPGFTGDVFALKGTPVARDLDKFLGWDVTQAAAVVELQWRKDESYEWVELTNLIQLNWRNVEPDEKAKTGASEKKAETEFVPPKAVPVE